MNKIIITENQFKTLILEQSSVPNGVTVSDVIRITNLRKMDMKIVAEIKKLSD